MRRILPLFVHVGLTLSAAAGLSPAAAGTLTVDPVLVEIGTARRAGSVTVRNVENVPVTIRAYPLAWSQAEGQDRYDETSGVIVSPPVFTIPAGGTQIVRVGLRQASAAPQSYRLIIEEVPAAQAGSGIRVALRLNLPLYSNLPSAAQSDIAWSASRLDDGQWAIEARNGGSGWVRIDAAAAERATGIDFADGFGFGTVLPGSARRWPIGPNPRIGDQARFQQIRSGNDGAAPPPPHAR
ncbi:MAG TPA: fimbria/pilus periplasmic chaperone [Allosphingosinicella sp.]|nr:fimbria/pilus periplasmic chaperone [Allosphingosinicella sp.]